MRNITKTYPNGQTVAWGQKPSPLRGKIVVITGKLESFTRAEAHRKVSQFGSHPGTDRHPKDRPGDLRGQAGGEAVPGQDQGNPHSHGAGISENPFPVKEKMRFIRAYLCETGKMCFNRMESQLLRLLLAHGHPIETGKEVEHENRLHPGEHSRSRTLSAKR